MMTLKKRMMMVRTRETVENSITQWYFEQGIPEPPWKTNKDPQWWKDYLIDMGLDPNNP